GLSDQSHMPPATRLPTIRAMKILIQTVALACALVVAVPLSMARQDDSNASATIGDGPDIVHEVPRLDAEMTVDGRHDVQFWAEAVAIAIDVETRPGDNIPARSEEHTSELQSRENLVCRLLLEKKKKK